MLTPSDISSIGNLPSAERLNIDLAAGDDGAESYWRNIVNARLQVQGNYVFWKARGGSTLVNAFFGNILTVYPFNAEVSGVTKQYLAVHTAAGKVYLWDIAAGSSNEIVSSGFSTTKKIQFASIGRMIYMFDYDGGQAKTYDITKSTSSDFISYNKSYISAVNWLAEDLEEDTLNIWGFKRGERVIVFPNATWDSGVEIYSSSGVSAGEKGYINSDLYSVNSFRYVNNGGKYLENSDGVPYKNTQFITFADGDAPFPFTVQGSGSDFTIEQFYIPLDEHGQPSFSSFVTRLDTASHGFVSYKDPNGVSGTAQIGGIASADIDDNNIVLPYNDDLDDLVGLPASKQLASDGGSVVESSKYERPAIYRQYVVFDMLNDGSVTSMGLPWQLEGTPSKIHVDGATKVKFTLTSPSGQVEQRFLAATRWQSDPQTAFDPTSEAYPDSPLFVIGEINKDRTFFNDSTPDRKILNSISEKQPTAAGVSELFGSGQLSADSIAQFRGALMAAGYTIARPIPDFYTNPASEQEGNIYVNITATTQLPNNMALAFMFEYSDGRRSNIVETEQFLQEGSTTTTTPVACDQQKATSSHSVTAGASTDGDMQVTYDGYTLVVSFTSASHSAAADAAEQIRQAIQGDADIRISAIVPSGSDLDYTEKRFGEEFNTLVIDWEPVLEAATGHIDVTANNLSGGGSENHNITIDGNSTSAITINDTDTLEQIVDKYVTEINNDVTISADWTASKVDNGDGTWRLLITADATGTAWDGKTISVSGDTDVSLTVESPTSGGKDDPGVSFDTEDPVMSGAQEPVGLPAKAFIFVEDNNIPSGGGSENHKVAVDGVDSDTWQADPGDTPADIHAKMVTAIDGTAALNTDWDAKIETVSIEGEGKSVVVIESKNVGDETQNGKSVDVDFSTALNVVYGLTAPGKLVVYNRPTETAGAAEGCIQATAHIDVSANNLSGSGSENHTITVDGVSTNPITINDTDTTEQIVDKYIAEIESVVGIDVPWKATKADQGGGTWRLLLTYREYGTTGNSRAVSISGDTDVSTSVSSPSSGGDDGGSVPSGSASDVNANRMQIHSLNTLVSKIYILGRTTSGGTTFHLIQEVNIQDPEAHGMIIDLPNSESELDDIETDTFTQPSAGDILETVELPGWLTIGVPFQQFQISAQHKVSGAAQIKRAIPLDFDTDKSTMRFQTMLFTDRDIQIGYLVDATQGERRIFTGEFAVQFGGMVSSSRRGITDVFGRIFWEANGKCWMWPRGGSPEPIFDKRRYIASDGNALQDAVYNPEHNEIWFFYSHADVIVLDLNSGLTRRMRYSGVGSVRAGAFFAGNLYIVSGTDLLTTDESANFTDKSGGDPVGIELETVHLGNELQQQRLLELTVYGQNASLGVEIDLQDERFESVATPWSDQFTADKTLTPKTLKMHGASFQVQQMAIMPRFRLSYDAISGGFVSAAVLKFVPTKNIGKARV